MVSLGHNELTLIVGQDVYIWHMCYVRFLYWFSIHQNMIYKNQKEFQSNHRQVWLLWSNTETLSSLEKVILKNQNEFRKNQAHRFRASSPTLKHSPHFKILARWCEAGHHLSDPSHKSHDAPDKYPTMHHFVTEMCTGVHISVTKWCIMGYGTGALWDLWIWAVSHMNHSKSIVIDTINN